MQILFPSSLIMMLTGRLANANDAPLSNNLRGLQNLPWKNGKDSSKRVHYFTAFVGWAEHDDSV